MAAVNRALTWFAGDVDAPELGLRADMVLIRLDVLEDLYLDPDSPHSEPVQDLATLRVQQAMLTYALP